MITLCMVIIVLLFSDKRLTSKRDWVVLVVVDILTDTVFLKPCMAALREQLDLLGWAVTDTVGLFNFIEWSRYLLWLSQNGGVIATLTFLETLVDGASTARCLNLIGCRRGCQLEFETTLRDTQILLAIVILVKFVQIFAQRLQHQESFITNCSFLTTMLIPRRQLQAFPQLVQFLLKLLSTSMLWRRVVSSLAPSTSIWDHSWTIIIIIVIGLWR